MEESNISNPKFSYSVTGGSKKNVLLDKKMRMQHNRNLNVWRFLVDNPTIKEGGIASSYDVYYNEELDAVMIADEYIYSSDDKMVYGLQDYLWMTIIHRPTFTLAPACRVEKKCFSLEAKNFGEVIEDRPVREVYDLSLLLKSEYDISV